MGGDFSVKGQQDCSKGIYCLAGKYKLEWSSSESRQTMLLQRSVYRMTIK